MKKYWAVIKELINNKQKIPYPSHFVYQNNQVTNETEIMIIHCLYVVNSNIYFFKNQ